MRRVRDVEQQAVAFARAAGEPDRRIDRDVVALRGTRARPEPGVVGVTPNILSMMPASAGTQRRAVRGRGRAGAAARLHDAVEQRIDRARREDARHALVDPDERALRARRIRGLLRRGHVGRGLAVPGRRHEVVEDARRAHDRGLLGMRERHLDHFDAEERRVRILVAAPPSTQPGSLVRRTHAGRARDVHVDVLGILGIVRAPCACANRGTSARWRRSLGCAMSVMSKMRRPRRRSVLTVSFTPWAPQSRRPLVPSPDTNSRFLYTDTSLCDAGQ